ncbi:hypothetical protein PHMEG_0008894 [Phytophthora megakarya]|uniref:Uncharacterized protein n=1 Tax=Phytophthora megakarya TaxID=4795 RepID=A0A225WJA2_9STRA|nr:hypothetical protein PHMEG_0008894 [Phytophthora megakarya]
MNAGTTTHQEMYDRLESQIQLGHRSNAILTKEVNHARSEYLVGIQAFKKFHKNCHKLLSLTDPTETTLTLELCERNRDLFRRVKRLEKAYSGLGARLRLEDMDPEVLVLMVEGLELDKVDWETMATDPQTRRALRAIFALKKQFCSGRSRFQHYCDIKSSSEHPSVLGGRICAVIVFLTFRGVFGHTCETVSVVDGLSSHSPPASTPPAPPVSGEKKGKGKRQRTGSDDEGVDFGSGASGEDAPKEGSPTKKSKPSPKSSLTKPSATAPAHGKPGSSPKKIDVASSAGQSAKSPPSKSKKSRSKKTGTKATPGYSSSDESVFSVSFESERESISDHNSSVSEGSEAHEDKASDLSMLRPKSQCLEDALDDILGAPAAQYPPTKNSCAEETSPMPKEKPLPAAKADSKSSPKDKMKGFAQVGWEEEVACEGHGSDGFQENAPVVSEAISFIQEVLGQRMIPDSSLEPEDIDSSWDLAFRGVDKDAVMEDGEVGEDDADSVATMDLDHDSADDTSAEQQDEPAEAALMLLFSEPSSAPESGVAAEI